MLDVKNSFESNSDLELQVFQVQRCAVVCTRWRTLAWYWQTDLDLSPARDNVNDKVVQWICERCKHLVVSVQLDLTTIYTCYDTNITSLCRYLDVQPSQTSVLFQS